MIVILFIVMLLFCFVNLLIFAIYVISNQFKLKVIKRRI